MIPLLFVASLTTMLTSAGSGASDSGEQMVRETANREFVAKQYPAGALKRGEQGRVTFQLTIEPDGSIGACDVTGSSGFAGLDRETCDLMVRFARTKPMRAADGRAIRATTVGHVVWALPGGTTKVASLATAKAAEKPDKLICKRTPTTGSLIAKTKQCMTRSQWAQQERSSRDDIERIQGRGFFDCKSNNSC